MTLSKYLILISLASLFLAGCDTGNIMGGPSERRAASLARNGEHSDAAAAYIGLASSEKGQERDRLTLLAIEQWLDAGDIRRAQSALTGVTKPPGGELRWLWNTDVAAIYLVEGRPDEALKILYPMSRSPLTLRHRSRVEALRADAWFQKNEPARAVTLYLQRENWLDDSRSITTNRDRLWAGLLVGDPHTMRAAAETNLDPVVSGWLSLGALAALTGQQGIGWSNGSVRWREAHPGHPGLAILGSLQFPDADALDFPRRIALLLPMTGSNRTAGRAIQNGFFGAYFPATSGLDDEQRVTVYDVGNGGVQAAYRRAVEDGAEFVVGPLLKRNVRILGDEALLPVPVLSLNYLPDDTIAPPGFYQFALAPEDEAAAAATRALSDGATNAVALYPNNDWGRRVMNSFATELEAGGGQLLDQRNYEPDTQDFSVEIENLMSLSQSVSRYNRLRANLGLPLQFDPRRRQDVDFVFLAANAKAGRLIKSQLKFHYAGRLPVYATSFIHALDGNSNSDLNGVMFADTPWNIAPLAWIADYPQLYSKFWPAERRMGRLHAMGYDAYQLVSSLFVSSEDLQSDIVGATGRLYVERDGRVHRRLAWAKFEQGVPVPLPDNNDYDDLLELDKIGEYQRLRQPTEWRFQQPGQ